MIFLIFIIGVVIALAAVFSVAFIPNKWARGFIVLVLVSGASCSFYQAGIMSEFLNISAKYNRPLSFAYQRIAQDIQAGQYQEAQHTATEMASLAYIAPRRWRDKNIEKITELTDK
jgi:hypothetical protein